MHACLAITSDWLYTSLLASVEREWKNTIQDDKPKIISSRADTKCITTPLSRETLEKTVDSL